MSKVMFTGTRIGLLVAVLVVIFVGLGLAGASASGVYATVVPTQTAAATAAASPGNLTVVGTGKVTVMPDVVRIQVGVETIGDTVAAATAENDKVMNAVLAALKKEGVAEKDIQTAYYSIYPEYQGEAPGPASSETRMPKIVGYRVSNSLTMTIRGVQDMKKVSTVLEAVVQAGANNVGGISLAVEDIQAVEDQARALAVADAKRRAEDLAKLTGVNVGPVMVISEIISGPPTVAAYDKAMSAAMGGGPAIMPGEQEYSVSIQVTYAIQ